MRQFSLVNRGDMVNQDLDLNISRIDQIDRNHDRKCGSPIQTLLAILSIFIVMLLFLLTMNYSEQSNKIRISPSVVSSSSSSLVPRRRAVITFVTSDYCKPASVLFKSFLRLCPLNNRANNTQRPLDLSLDQLAALPAPYKCGLHFIIIYHPSFNVLDMAKHQDCDFMIQMNVSTHEIPIQAVPANSEPGQTNYAMSLNKLGVFNLDMFDRILFLDADTILVRGLMDYFNSMFDMWEFMGVVDQWDGCNRREVLNGGVLVFTPSRYLYGSMQTMLLDGIESCLSGNWRWQDQELFNCLCGFAGSKKPFHHDITCRILPSYMGSFIKTPMCKEYRPSDVHLIHFVAGKSPWRKMIDHPYYQFWDCIDKASVTSQTYEDDCRLLE